MRKKFLLLFTAALLFTCSACGESASLAEQSDSEPKSSSIEQSELSTTPAQPGMLTYTNLDSEAAVQEVKQILTAAGIEASRVDTTFSWVADFNDCMRGCEAFSLIGDFTTIDEPAVDYGEYGSKSMKWFNINKRDYHDVLCRTVAYELNAPNITIKNLIPREKWDCWDEVNSALRTDGEIFFGAEAGEYSNALIPCPLLDWDDDTIQKYFSLFNPVPIPSGCGEQEMYTAIRQEWHKRGISFGDGAYSLLSLWMQHEDLAFMAHAATLVPDGDGYLLFEKTNPQAPYAATKFITAEDAKQYLYDTLLLEYSYYDDLEPGTVIFLQNDQQI